MSEPSDPSDEKRISRRGFFGALLREGFASVEKAGRAVADGMQHALPSEGKPSRAQPNTIRPPQRFLRPPGALPLAQFADKCSKCGDCVKVCPAEAIKLHEGIAGGLPYIEALRSPCVICDDLACMKACPTGALELVDRTQIRMGLAQVNYETCIRKNDQPCTLCISECPIGPTAIGLDSEYAIEVRDGCTGCGVCERACPTHPTSILIKPL